MYGTIILPPDVLHRNTLNILNKHRKTHLFTSSLSYCEALHYDDKAKCVYYYYYYYYK